MGKISTDPPVHTKKKVYTPVIIGQLIKMVISIAKRKNRIDMHLATRRLHFFIRQRIRWLQVSKYKSTKNPFQPTTRGQSTHTLDNLHLVN